MIKQKMLTLMPVDSSVIISDFSKNPCPKFYSDPGSFPRKYNIPHKSLANRNKEDRNPYRRPKQRNKKQISRGSYESSRHCRVFELDMSDQMIKNIPRSGIIFYTFIEDELFFCLGRDKKSRDLSDFGGGRRKSENPVECAVREGNEESRFTFSKLTPEQVQGYFCLYSSNMLIIFVPVASPETTDVRLITEENFSKKLFLTDKQKISPCFNEISGLVWLDEYDITNLFSDRPKRQMFAKVRRFIYSCNYFSQNISNMKYLLSSVIESKTKLVNTENP